MTELELFRSFNEEDDLLQSSVMELFDGKSELNILEAGCGQHWPLNLGAIKYKLTGIDLDQDALAHRLHVLNDLDEAIVADLRTLDLGNRKFDVIYNAFVLEHVENAALVLDNFSRWLKPGGLIILKLPDRNSVFGFITNATPFFIHVLYHKYFLARENAGKPGFGPYPTHYDPIVSRNGIRAFCDTHGFKMREERGFGPYVIGKSMKKRLVRIVAVAVSALSLGRLPWKHNNLTYVLQKE